MYIYIRSKRFIVKLNLIHFIHLNYDEKSENSKSFVYNPKLLVFSVFDTEIVYGDNEDLQCVKDDAIGAVGKIARYSLTQDVNEQNEVLKYWIQYLPCKNDEEEARNIHDNLIYFIQNQNPFISSKSDLCMQIFQACVSRDSDYSLPERKILSAQAYEWLKQQQ